MSTVLTIALVSHILLGVIGTMTAYVVWRELLRAQPHSTHLRRSSLATLFTWLGAWLSGGYYYTVYYGANVKPVIKAGQYAWAHSVFMEWKEHIFLFLPFLALVLWLAVRREPISSSISLKGPLVWLSGLTWFLALFITGAGILVSGAVQ